MKNKLIISATLLIILSAFGILNNTSYAARQSVSYSFGGGAGITGHNKPKENEPPKEETPKEDEPKKEIPKEEEPKKEEPKKEEPKKEEPKKENKKPALNKKRYPKAGPKLETNNLVLSFLMICSVVYGLIYYSKLKK